MRKLTAILITAIILTTTASAVTWVQFSDINEMIWGRGYSEHDNGAALIIIGTVVDYAESDNFWGRESTSIHVEEVLTGDVQVGETIKQISKDWEPLFNIGETFLLFLDVHMVIENPFDSSVHDANTHDFGEWLETDYFSVRQPGGFAEIGQEEVGIKLWHDVDYTFYSLTEIREIIAAGRPEPTPPVTTPEPVTGDEPNPPTSVTLAIIPTLLAGSVALLSIKHRKTRGFVL
jgi:hypothetical protein